ncbi:hypothetical protein [Blastococcus sp. TF02-09]|uniref:hypothetical protein n=1 Tax=Blastococcus sp. TF02-09 TaxID=2250576 RepID=UPI0011BF6A67|nr:hypothetical protein [Blastococcus sp. TF02-9]
MIDRTAYLEQMAGRNLPIDYLPYDSWLSYYTDEFLWSWLLAALTRDLGVAPDTVLNCVAWLTLFVFSLTILQRTSVWYLCLLANPLVVDFAFSQSRSALAISLLGIALLLGTRFTWLRVLLAGAAVLVHSSMPLFLAFYALARFVLRHEPRTEKAAVGQAAVLMTAGAVVALATGPLRVTILNALGDRRVEYPENTSSLLFMSFWVLLLVWLLVDWRDSVRRIDAAIIVPVLTVAAVNIPLQGYSTRFLVALFPFMIVAIARLNRRWSGLPGVIYAAYTVLQWAYWLRFNETF